MVSITVSVPEEIREIMKKSPEVNWSGLVRKAITEKARQLAIKQELISHLRKEEKFNEWSVNLIRKGRKNENSG